MASEDSVVSALRTMSDKAAIVELITTFGAALDAKDWDAYGACFTPDGQFTIMGQTRVGRRAIVAGPARDLDGFGTLQHFITNHRVNVDGDAAASSHYVQAIHILHASAPHEHADLGARYDCRSVRTASGWRLTHVTLTVLWTAGVPFQIPARSG